MNVKHVVPNFVIQIGGGEGGGGGRGEGGGEKKPTEHSYTSVHWDTGTSEQLAPGLNVHDDPHPVQT